MIDSDNSDIETVEYDPANDTYTAQFRADTELASTALAEALADVRRCRTVELDPLYHSVDTDALDSLIESAAGESLEVSLTIDEFDVRVVSDGRIEITPPETSGG